jgi:hypothetical protein
VPGATTTTRNARAIHATLDRCEEICRRVGSPPNALLAAVERANLTELAGDTAECERQLRAALEGFRAIHANQRVVELETRLDG